MPESPETPSQIRFKRHSPVGFRATCIFGSH